MAGLRRHIGDDVRRESSTSTSSTSSDEKTSPTLEKHVNDESGLGPGDGGQCAEGRSIGGNRIVAQGPEAEILAQKYADTLARHSRLNPDNTPPAWSRAVLLIFVALLFWYAIEGRMRVIEWKRSISADKGLWDQDYTDMDHLSPMAENHLRPGRRIEL